MLIFFAWFFEVFGVIFGAANSLVVTFGEDPNKWPTNLVAYSAAAPLIVLAACELLRIPMAAAYHMPRSFWLKALGLTAFIGLWGIGIENWTFGIERMVALRLKPAEAIHIELRQIDRQIADTIEEQKRAAGALAAAQTDLDEQIKRDGAALKANAERIAEENRAHAEKIAKIADYCMKIKEICVAPQTKQENDRHNEVMKSLNKEAADISASLSMARKRVEGQATEAREGPSVVQLERDRNAIKDKLAREVRDNSIHRIAAAWFHVPAENLTEEQLAKAKNFFSLFGAIIVSGVAGAAAFIYYAPASKPWIKRSIRGLIARLRKRVVREVKVDVEKIVHVDVPGPPEKEIPVLLKETTVKIVPVRGLVGEQQPFTVIDKVTGHEAEAKLRSVKGGQP